MAGPLPRLGAMSRLLPQPIVGLAVRGRRFSARHRFVAAIPMITLGVAVGIGVAGHVRSLDAARRSWQQQVHVVTMRHAVGAGRPIAADDVEIADVPIAGIAPESIESLPAGAVALDDLSPGEMLLANHLVANGAGRLPAGARGVSVARHDASLDVRVGDAVQVLSIEPPNGGDDPAPRTVAARAVVVGVTDDAVLVAVTEADAPLVAQAAVLDRAVLVLLPN